MNKFLFAGILLAPVFLLLSCENKTATIGAAQSGAGGPLKSEFRSFVKRHCVNDEQCADYTIHYPTITEGDSALVSAVNKAICDRLIGGLGGNYHLPFEVALDSAGVKFIDDFIRMKREIPENTMNQMIQVTGSLLLNNEKVTTVKLDFYSFTGGAHPNISSGVMSFDLFKQARQLTPVEIFPDPNAVMPMLEKAYKENKGLKESDDVSTLLLDGLKKLPLPANVGIVPEGILFAYNDYEVAPHAVGPADIILTWEQLGGLADKKRWIN